MYVVTGGAGFIGSNIVAALEERGDEDIAVCDVFGTDEKWKNLAKRTLAYVVSPEKLMGFLDDHREDITAIFHMGAISSTTETDVDLIMSSNFELTTALWQWCAKHDKRLIYASSAATYGDGDQGFVDNDNLPALEKLRPMNAYGWSKHLVDKRIVSQINKKRKAPAQWVGLKFFNVYGPNEYHKGSMQSVIAHLYPKISAGEPAKLFKSYKKEYPHGGQLRDFVWVGDCVDVMMWFLDNPKQSGIFNVGTGKAQPFSALATAIFTALTKKPDIEFFEMPETLREKYQYYTQADMSRLRKAGYKKPFTSLQDGTKEYVLKYLATADPYR
ncbi:MAG: ADP-glyceromanno-heptose 6-epimerase [Alphaproteobacteria bacterium]|jgi:ADP-L-glycero-D-manno-heptose 6-epimerase|nr:ADP-glyceromanno-heptose 6-epimerase [Alphaproteobacteria bacterium]MBT5389251.1 ADP-glyceromanno-heptose 6-epimerase [Alphaproteobacteria bacterium]MBT5540505.1 ADP-glyceromanno-heptose 6-epimerase [Alphaproteobacteria bacterium]